MALQTYHLVMVTGPTPGKRFDLTKNEILIGRDASSDIVINDAEVSRRHARLLMQAGGYVIEDLGSTNGTTMNGQRLTGPYPLHPGETIAFGDNVSLTFEVVKVEPDATMISAPLPARIPAAAQPAPAQTSAGYQPVEPVYSGQVSLSPDEPVPPEQEKQGLNRNWVIAGCGCLAILACAVVIGILWYIDSNYLWCQVFPFIPTCP